MSCLKQTSCMCVTGRYLFDLRLHNCFVFLILPLYFSWLTDWLIRGNFPFRELLNFKFPACFPFHDQLLLCWSLTGKFAVKTCYSTLFLPWNWLFMAGDFITYNIQYFNNSPSTQSLSVPSIPTAYPRMHACMHIRMHTHTLIRIHAPLWKYMPTHFCLGIFLH